MQLKVESPDFGPDLERGCIYGTKPGAPAPPVGGGGPGSSTRKPTSLAPPPGAQQAYLKASNTDANDQFGFPVAVSGDTVVVVQAKEGVEILVHGLKAVGAP